MTNVLMQVDNQCTSHPEDIHINLTLLPIFLLSQKGDSTMSVVSCEHLFKGAIATCTARQLHGQWKRPGSIGGK